VYLLKDLDNITIEKLDEFSINLPVYVKLVKQKNIIDWIIKEG
jgi:hypothetical protein